MLRKNTFLTIYGLFLFFVALCGCGGGSGSGPVVSEESAPAVVPEEGPPVAVPQESPVGTLSYATFVGGSRFDRVQGVTVDSAGYIYIGGNTQSADFPVNAYDTNYHTSLSFDPNDKNDGFVAKLTPDGKTLVWSTYLGGSERDQVYGIRVDSTGVYVVGATSSTDFPTTSGAVQETYGGGSYGDIFITKLTLDGMQLIYSTFVGGSQQDGSRGDMFVDSTGTLYVSGHSESADFPTTPGAYQGTLNGFEDAVLFRLSADGSDLLFSTYFGGSGGDNALSGIFRHSDGSVIIAGATDSADLPTTLGAFDTTYNGGSGGTFGGDGYVARFSEEGASLLYATYLGGTGDDYVLHNQGLWVESNGNIVVVGSTTSSDFPTTPNAYRKTPAGGVDGFVAILPLDGKSLLASTYIGGSMNEEMSGIMVDPSGHVYVSGNTHSADYPVSSNAFQRAHGGGKTDVLVTQFSPDLSELLYSTFLGGSGSSSLGERGRGVWAGSEGRLVLCGDTDSTDFPVTAEAFQYSYKGGAKDGFLALFAF